MPKPFRPWPYQELMIDYALRHERCCLFVPMGMGKTSAALAVVRELVDIWGDSPVLVIAPLAVARTTWPAEVEKWDEFRDLRISVIVGNQQQRIRAIRAEADIHVINYDNLYWLIKDALPSLGMRWPWKTVIADESTRLKGFRTRQGTKRAKALGTVSALFIRFIGLTGTPAPNGLQDLWGQMWFVDRGHRLGTSYSAFLERWFTPMRVGADPHAVQWIPREHAQRQIQTAISDVCLSIKAEDYFDLDEPRHVLREVVLPDDIRATYDELERNMLVELEGGALVEAVNAAAKTIKLLQLANGAVYVDDDLHWQEIHTAKLEALESIVEEAGGEPLLVAYQFQSDLARLLKRFPHAVKFDGKRETVDAFNAGRIQMLLVHPASAGHGISLQDGTSKLVFFSQWWNLEEYQQVIERIGPMRQLQAGHPKVVTTYSIVARGTVDEAALAAKRAKKTVQDALLDYLRSKNNVRNH